MRFAGRLRARLIEIVETGLLRELGLPALAVSLVMFVSAMTLLSANVSELRHSYANMQRSSEALLVLETIANDVLRVEMTVRGYLLSGDEVYLTWKDLGAARMHDQLQTAANLLNDDSKQRDNLNKLSALLAGHCAYFDALAKRAPRERETVIAEIVAYGRRVGRRPIELQIAAMRSREIKELALEQRQAEKRVVGAYHSALGLSAAALLFAGIGFSLLVHDRRHKRQQRP